MENSSRWYDKDPRAALAVGCLEKAGPLTQRRLARAIIKKAKSLHIEAKEHHPGLFRRWYDENRALSLAMEYYRLAPALLQRAISEYLIVKLSND